MNMQTPARVADRQQRRAAAGAFTELFRANALLDRTPDDWHDRWDTAYPPRAARRASKPRHAPTGCVTERQNRSDATPAKTRRARRVRVARRAVRAARWPA